MFSPTSFETADGYDDDDDPALIVLCTWLGGATAKRIQRYTRGYNALWPRARILLIRTTAAEYAFWSVKSLQQKLRPAHCEIRKTLLNQNAARILLHVFSNGGANTATQLAASMNGILQSIGHAHPLPLRQIILDSCPGDLSIHKTYKAAAHSIPATFPLRFLGCATLYLLVAGIAGMETVGLRRPLGKSIRDGFNDHSMFPGHARRLYLTSRGDTIVDSGHVQTHRQQAAAAGLSTEELVFERAGHCSLVLEDQEAYWKAIASCWQRSSRSSSDFASQEVVHVYGLQGAELARSRL